MCSRVVTRGSTSIEISASVRMGNASTSERNRRWTSAGASQVGVPPPQCSCVAARGTRVAARTASISRSIVSR